MEQRNNKTSEKGDRKRVERKRYLNVIYFVDSRRTRTLKYSIERTYLTVGIIAASIIWSVTSTALLIRERYVIREMTEHTQTLLGIVFNYQTRYDEVYEKAYPSRDTAPQMVSDSYLDEEDKEEAPAPKPEKPTETIALKAKAPPPASANASANASGSPKANAEKTEIPISVDNFSTQLSENSLTARLSLKNLNSPSKTEGTITASARFVDGDNVAITLQSTPQPTEDGPATDHFNIRYFKNRSFFFEIPEGKVGRFLSVTVTLRDDKGRQREFLYALNKDADNREARVDGNKPKAENANSEKK